MMKRTPIHVALLTFVLLFAFVSVSTVAAQENANPPKVYRITGGKPTDIGWLIAKRLLGDGKRVVDIMAKNPELTGDAPNGTPRVIHRVDGRTIWKLFDGDQICCLDELGADMDALTDKDLADIHLQRVTNPVNKSGKQGEAELVLTQKVVGDREVEDGTAVTFDLTLTNLGPATARNIKVAEQFPAGIEFYTSNFNKDHNFDIGSKVWTVPELPAGRQANLQVSGFVHGSGFMATTATITHADQVNPIPANTKAVATLNVSPAGVGVSPWWLLLLIPVVALFLLIRKLNGNAAKERQRRIRVEQEQQNAAQAHEGRAAIVEDQAQTIAQQREVMAHLMDDPATSGPPVIDGGVTDETVDGVVLARAQQDHRAATGQTVGLEQFIIQGSRKVRVYGHLYVSYAPPTLPRIIFHDWQRMYEHTVLFPDGRITVLYTNVLCGNDARFQGVREMIPQAEFQVIEGWGDEPTTTLAVGDEGIDSAATDEALPVAAHADDESRKAATDALDDSPAALVLADGVVGDGRTGQTRLLTSEPAAPAAATDEMGLETVADAGRLPIPTTQMLTSLPTPPDGVEAVGTTAALTPAPPASNTAPAPVAASWGADGTMTVSINGHQALQLASSNGARVERVDGGVHVIQGESRIVFNEAGHVASFGPALTADSPVANDKLF